MLVVLKQLRRFLVVALALILSGTAALLTTLPSFKVAQASIGFVKNIGTASSNSLGSSLSVAVPAGGVAAGNSLIVTFAIDGTAAGAVTVSDSQGNTYSADVDVTNALNVRALMLSSHHVVALTSGDEITVTHPLNSLTRAVSVNEFSGLDTEPLDESASATGNSMSPSSGSAATTTQADELLVGAIGVRGPSTDGFTEGTNYTALQANGTASGLDDITIYPEYRIVSATGTYLVPVGKADTVKHEPVSFFGGAPGASR